MGYTGMYVKSKMCGMHHEYMAMKQLETNHFSHLSV
jgi:hypothetical protein